MGTRKAAVLPEPVWAQDIRSRPFRITGMEFFCTGVGCGPIRDEHGSRDQPITAHLDTGWMLLSSSSRSHTSSQSCFSSFSGRYLQS